MSQPRECSDLHQSAGHLHDSDSSWQSRAACEALDTWRRDSTQGKPAKPKEQEWTVAYYLGADKTSPEPGAKPSGAPEKAEQLRKMASETAGKPVTAFVDVLRETDKARQAKLERLKKGDDSAVEPSHNPDDYAVDHYRLKDGKAVLLGSNPSKGIVGDVEHLLHDAGKDPSKKIGLVINADGGGNRGQQSDSSLLTSNNAIKNAIQRGLQGSGHQQLDILNFDECLMSQAGALTTFKDVTKDIVASSETERVAHGVNGQNLGAELHDLLLRPSMDGRQWGDQIIADAKAGRNDRSKKPGEQPNITDAGTATLANIDPTKLADLWQAVDSLGKQLQVTTADPRSKAAVDKIISDLPRLGVDPSIDSSIYQKRDLKSFTEALRKSIDSGAVTDPDGKLRKAIDGVSITESAAVTSYRGAKMGGYDQQGGVSVYLPDQVFRDVDRTLAKQTALYKAADLLERFDGMARDPRFAASDPSHEATAGGAYNQVGIALQSLTEEQKQQARPLTDLLKKLRADTNAADRERDLHAAMEAAHALLRSPLQGQLVGQIDRAKADKTQAEARELELSSDPSGWSSWIRSLDWHA